MGKVGRNTQWSLVIGTGCERYPCTLPNCRYSHQDQGTSRCPRNSEDSRLGAVNTVPQLSSRICETLLQCSRKLRLYPQAHPRVQECIQALKADLATHSYETGRPFSLNTGATLEETARAGRRQTESADMAIGRLLKLHLIESVALLPEATEDELVQFCSILHEDIAKQLAEGEETGIDPDDWGDIRLSYYTPQDLPGALSVTGTPLERAAGVRRIKDIQALLDNLGEQVRGPLQKALTEPAFLQKVCDLRRALKKRQSAWQGIQGKRVDLFSEVLRSTLTSPEVSADPASASGKVLSAVESLLGFLEKNVDGLSLSLRTLQGGQAANPMTQQLQEALQTSPEISRVVNSVQVQKQRLAFLFHTSSSLDPGAAQDASALPQASPRPGDTLESLRKKEPEPVATFLALEDRFKAVRYDVNHFRAQVETAKPAEIYLQVVLELLEQCEHKTNVGKLKGLIAQTLLETASAPAGAGGHIASLCDSIKNTGNRQAEELLAEVLYRVSPPQTTLYLLESIVLSRGGPRIATTCLIRLTEREPKKAIALLFATHRDSRTVLRSVAEARLVSLASHPDMVVRWAMEYPEGLLLPSVITKVLGGLGPERTLKAFRVFFANVTEVQAARLLEALPAGIPEGENVLYAAMGSGPAGVRKLAIANLRKYSTPSVVATLKEILKANNYKKTPDMDEVNAVLGALACIQEHGAKGFLREVREQRDGLAHAYRKEIRKASRNLAPARKEAP